MIRLGPWLLLVSLAAGCASTALDEAPPRSGLEALALYGASGAPLEPSSRTSGSRDAESAFARGRRSTRRQGSRALSPDPASDANLASLLDQRPVLRGPSRLACLEVRGAREYVSVGCFGDQDSETDAATFWARSVEPTQLAILRNALRREAIPSAALARARPEEWPRAEAAPVRPPFGAVVGVPSVLLPPSGSIRQLRLAGARVGADAVLILTRSTRVYRYHNALANLYPLLIGLALPAREEVAVSRVEAALVGVRTGHVFAVAAGEARLEESGWLLLRARQDSRDMARSAEERAIYHMTRDLSREIAQLESEGRLVPKASAGPRL